MITVYIPLPTALPTPNQRWHWAQLARVRKEMRTTAGMIGLSVRAGNSEAMAKGPRRVSVTLVRGKGARLIDGDAVLTALKGTTDGLVDAGLLIDDSPKHLTWGEVKQERGKTPEARYEITDA